MEKGTVINRLIGWAKWKLVSGNALGFPKASSFTHLVVDGSRQNLSVAEIDSWCIETDKAVCELECNDKDLYFLIRVEYLSNVRELKMKLELTRTGSKSTYYRRLDDAYKQISNSLEKKSCKRETSLI